MYLVRRSKFESWKENYKTLEDRKSCECYVSKTIQETNWNFFFPFSLCIFSVLIIFHSHFWLSIEQQNGRVHI